MDDRDRAAEPRRFVRGLGAALLGGLVCAGLLGLSGCATQPNAKEARDSFVEVKKQARQPEPEQAPQAEPEPAPEIDPVGCKPYLVLTVRGTGEPVKGQLLSPVAKTIAKARPKSVLTVDLDYPADTDVKEGATAGVRVLVATLNTQAEACPEQSFVLLGYSQGALVIGDSLSAPADRLVGEAAGEVSDDAASRILAVVLYGDPRFIGAASYNMGTFDPLVDGVLPRLPGSLDAYGERLRDYCVAKDIVCQGRLALDEKGHVAYYKNGMQQDGAAFAITKLHPIAEDPKSADGGPDHEADGGGEETPPAADQAPPAG